VRICRNYSEAEQVPFLTLTSGDLPEHGKEAPSRRSHGQESDQEVSAERLLEGVAVIVNPGLMGVRFAQLWFDVRLPSAKDDLIRKLSSTHGVLAISDSHGPSLSLVIMYESETFCEETVLS